MHCQEKEREGGRLACRTPEVKETVERNGYGVEGADWRGMQVKGEDCGGKVKEGM